MSSNFTPLPKHLHHKSAQRNLFFLSLVPFLTIVILTIAYFQYQRIQEEKGSIGSIQDRSTPTPIVSTQSAQLDPTPATSLPQSWSLRTSNRCGVSFGLPPAEEPYIVPRDPNTPPATIDDEGKFWMFEEYDSELFLFNTTTRMIFKDPSNPGEGFVSASVEVYCKENDEKLSTESLLEKLHQDLDENVSIVKISETLDDTRWGQPVKAVRFQGGVFGNEQYLLLATPSYMYLIREYGQSTNPDVTTVRQQIMDMISFE